MKRWIMLVPVLIAATAVALPEQQLVPNWNFSEKPDPLKFWRYTYPHQQDQYSKNHEYVKVVQQPGKGNVVEFACPLKQGNMGGIMFETAFIKCEPGATYKAEVEASPKDMRMMIMVEAWVPLPDSINIKPGLRVWPAENGLPRLMMCGRKRGEQHHGSWKTIRETYTVPKTVNLALKDTPPTHISVKVYADVPNVKGKPISNAYVASVRLTKSK